MVPDLIEEIARYQANIAYRKAWFFSRKFCKEDFKQEIYLRIWDANLWDCKLRWKLNIVALRACIDYVRTNVKGYRKQNAAIEVDIDKNFEHTLLYHENYESIDIKLSVYKLIDTYCTEKQKELFIFILQDKGAVGYARKKGVTDATASLMKKAAMDKIRKKVCHDRKYNSTINFNQCR